MLLSQMHLNQMVNKFITLFSGHQKRQLFKIRYSQLTLGVTNLNHSNLIGHEAVSDNNVARCYVQTLLCHCGSNQQVDFTISEFVQNIPLLCLNIKQIAV